MDREVGRGIHLLNTELRVYLTSLTTARAREATVKTSRTPPRPVVKATDREVARGLTSWPSDFQVMTTGSSTDRGPYHELVRISFFVGLPLCSTNRHSLSEATGTTTHKDGTMSTSCGDYFTAEGGSIKVIDMK
uniref:Integrase core domain containing protein n=1 Tax=Solanum tuberosum TaxID=4113 RepID=M1DAX1_SOLTU